MSYLVIEAGPGVNIHTADPIGDPFETLADARTFIKSLGLKRVQVIALDRRWLRDRELQDLGLLGAKS